MRRPAYAHLYTREHITRTNARTHSRTHERARTHAFFAGAKRSGASTENPSTQHTSGRRDRRTRHHVSHARARTHARIFKQARSEQVLPQRTFQRNTHPAVVTAVLATMYPRLLPTPGTTPCTTTWACCAIWSGCAPTTTPSRYCAKYRALPKDASWKRPPSICPATCPDLNTLVSSTAEERGERGLCHLRYLPKNVKNLNTYSKSPDTDGYYQSLPDSTTCHCSTPAHSQSPDAAWVREGGELAVVELDILASISVGCERRQLPKTSSRPPLRSLASFQNLFDLIHSPPCLSQRFCSRIAQRRQESEIVEM
eukprot:2946135-Pleurochrysis_carterae.AAC.4